MIYKELKAMFTADTSKLIDGLKKADHATDVSKSKLSSLASSFQKGGMLMATGVIAVGTALYAATDKVATFAQEIKHMSDTTGMSTDTLQRLRSLSKHVGVDFESLAGTAGILTRKLLQVENDGGMASKVFEKLGVSVNDSHGKMRNMNELFPELVEKLQAITNPTERNAMATQLFGRNMADIAPILAMNSDEMKKYMANVKPMTEAQIKAADDIKKSMNDIKMQIDGVIKKLIVELLPDLKTTIIPFIKDTLIPAIKSITETLVKVIKAFDKLPQPVKSATAEMILFAVALKPVYNVLGGMITRIPKLVSGIKDLIAGIKGFETASAAGNFGAWLAGGAAGTSVGVGAAASVGLGLMLKTAYDNYGALSAEDKKLLKTAESAALYAKQHNIATDALKRFSKAVNTKQQSRDAGGMTDVGRIAAGGMPSLFGSAGGSIPLPAADDVNRIISAQKTTNNKYKKDLANLKQAAELLIKQVHGLKDKQPKPSKPKSPAHKSTSKHSAKVDDNTSVSDKASTGRSLWADMKASQQEYIDKATEDARTAQDNALQETNAIWDSWVMQYKQQGNDFAASQISAYEELVNKVTSLQNSNTGDISNRVSLAWQQYYKAIADAQKSENEKALATQNEQQNLNMDAWTAYYRAKGDDMAAQINEIKASWLAKAQDIARDKSSGKDTTMQDYINNLTANTAIAKIKKDFADQEQEKTNKLIQSRLDGIKSLREETEAMQQAARDQAACEIERRKSMIGWTSASEIWKKAVVSGYQNQFSARFNPIVQDKNRAITQDEMDAVISKQVKEQQTTNNLLTQVANILGLQYNPLPEY